jgi:predicted porin
MYNWGVGIRIGNPNKNKMLPYLQYSNSSFTTQNVDANNIKMDSALKIQEYMLGFNLILKRFKSNGLTAKFGYIHSVIDDDLIGNSGDANGLQIGFGYEAKFLKNSRVYINYSYDFLKYTKASFRDYDIQKLSIGFML